MVAYSIYDQTIQACNRSLGCVISSLLCHCDTDEVSTFWILVSLLENYEMRSFYQKGLPGVALYGEVLMSLMSIHLKDLHTIFQQYDVSYFTFFESWVKELFTGQMPLSLQGKFIGNFLCYQWSYFFRVCLSLLVALEKEIKHLANPKQSKKKVQQDIVDLLRLITPS